MYFANLNTRSEVFTLKEKISLVSKVGNVLLSAIGIIIIFPEYLEILNDLHNLFEHHNLNEAALCSTITLKQSLEMLYLSAT